jgi:alpha-glucosidase
VRQRNLDLPEGHEVLRELRKVLDDYGDRFALGEVPIGDDARLAEYFGGDGLHTVFHIAFWEQPWRARAFRDTVDGLAARSRPGALPTYALGTHDVSRTVTRYGSTARARVAALMALTLPGVPCVYYGEELGMADTTMPPGTLLDVDGRDGARQPMYWDETGAGFSTAAPWLPCGTDQAEANVARQHGDPDALLNLYRRLIRYRRGSATLRHGDYRSLDTSEDTFAYLRSGAGERILVALNFASRAGSLNVPELPGRGRVEVSTHRDHTGAEVCPRTLPLAPDEGMIVRLEDSP